MPQRIIFFDGVRSEKKCEKFLAISLIFQHDNRTMVDSEVSDYVAKVMSLLKRNNLKVAFLSFLIQKLKFLSTSIRSS